MNRGRTMALTTDKVRKGARKLGLQIFPPETTATMHFNDLVAAIDSIDTAMETVINNIPPAWGTKTIKQALIDNLPEPFKSNSTARQKALALRLWAEQEVG